MVTREELLSLLSDLESDRVERTQAISKTDKFAEAICAFANDFPHRRQPGYLILGVDDQGKPAGLSVADELLRNLGNIRSDGNVLPAPAMVVERFVLEGGEVAVVEVQPSDLPPVRYKGRVWIRVGPRRAVANEQEERLLTARRSSLVHTFDARPVPEAGLRDLSLRLFWEYCTATIDPDILVANHRTDEEKLASLRCYDVVAQRPTVAGILLFGANIRYFLPGAYVQFLRFPGTTMVDEPVDQLEITGDLRSVLDGVRHKITAYNRNRLARDSGLRERTVSDYPEWALRELLHNAVMHRDYESTSPIRFYWFQDRIEIQSPGGLYGMVTRETLTRRNSYRNPILAEAMKAMGYVNKYGYGIQRAEAMMKENGNPALMFDIDEMAFAVTLGGRSV